MGGAETSPARPSKPKPSAAPIDQFAFRSPRRDLPARFPLMFKGKLEKPEENRPVQRVGIIPFDIRENDIAVLF